MHVASANAARLNSYEQLIFTRLRFCHLDEVEFLVFGENERFHGFSL
jgi:hypothetical protein